MKTRRQIIFASALQSDVCVFAAAQPPILGASSSETQSPPAEFVWMPKGKHAISAGTADGEGFQGEVLVDEAGFRAVVASFERSIAAGKRVWVDFNHEDRDAAAWIKSFAWDAARGILASVEWTAKGAEALKEKLFYSFSPVFTRDRETSRVTGIWEGHAAGGLVNKPAFGAAMPALIAAQLAGAESADTATGGTPVSQKTIPMNKEQLIALLASLGVKHAADATEQQLVDLVLAYKPAPDTTAATLAALKSDLDAIKASLAKPAPAAKPEPVIVAAVPTATTDPVVVTAQPLEILKAMASEKDATKRGQIYVDARDFVSKHAKSNTIGTILAANTLGTLTPELIVQQSLDLLKLSFPILRGITTDFSTESVKYGQEVNSRIITVPTVGTYNTSTGYGIANTTTTDVPVTINAHKHITISYHANELGGTVRNLFAEQVEAMNYALGKDLVDALYALFVIATYTNATTVATASITRITVPVAIASALNARGVPMVGRTLLLNSAAFAKLAEDSTIMNLAANQRGDLITEYQLPKIAGLQPVEAVNLPATGNMTGFALSKDAAVIATRLPADYLKALPGAAHGASSIITNADTGLSVLKTDFVDHTLGAAVSRIAWMYGVAAGQVASGQILKSA